MNKRGFTLIELLVTMAILTTLVAVAAVSTKGTQDKGRADRTARMGRQLIEDLERAEGLSFVSDFGRLPETDEELRFLLTHTYTNLSGAVRSVPLFTREALDFPPTVPSTVRAAVQLPQLGGGWRGPYSRVAQSVEGPLVDGWGNPFSFSSNILTSRGRNDLPGGSEWQDRDQSFEVFPNRVANVQVEVGVERVRASDGTTYFSSTDFSSLTIYAVLFQPAFGAGFDTIEASEAGSFGLTVSGATVGTRALLVYAQGTLVGGSPATYVGGARTLLLAEGSNHVTITLREI